ncbi:hypothetical protein KCU96_g27, partial [Aureobasidium melanogenum]
LPLRVCVLEIRTSRLLWQSHGRRRIRTVSSSSDAFWACWCLGFVVCLRPVVCLFSSQSRLFGNTGLLVLSGLVPSLLTGFSKVFLPSCQIEGPGLKLGGSFLSRDVDWCIDSYGRRFRRLRRQRNRCRRSHCCCHRSCGVSRCRRRSYRRMRRRRVLHRGWRLFGYLLLSSFESLEEGSFNLRRSDGRRDFSLMRCTVLSFRPLTVAIMKLDEVCAKVFSSWAWASRAFVFSSSCLATSSLPVAVFISAGAADQVLPWRARFPDPRSAFEWRHHFFSLTLCKVCISVCQSLSLVLQVLLQLSELSCQILVSLFSSRSCRSCSTSDRAAASSAINLSFSFLATASLSTAAFRAV